MVNVVLQQMERNNATAATFTICTFSDKDILWAEVESKPHNMEATGVQKPNNLWGFGGGVGVPAGVDSSRFQRRTTALI